MIPQVHLLVLGLLLLGTGLFGVVLRRAGLAVFLSAMVSFNGVLLLVCAGLGQSGASSQAEGIEVLALMVAVGLAGAAVLYGFFRFVRPVVLDEQDRLKN
ncbi:MAG: hypothetical protein D6806_00380 [Deltaproteobacteria bacterium]|nr:MAG: hypothetical protein D6806_00380 [Deltaproteobacteria bacterium]